MQIPMCVRNVMKMHDASISKAITNVNVRMGIQEMDKVAQVDDNICILYNLHAIFFFRI